MFLDSSFWKYPVLLHCYTGVGVVCSKAQLQLRALLVALQVRERYPVVVCLANQD